MPRLGDALDKSPHEWGEERAEGQEPLALSSSGTMAEEYDHQDAVLGTVAASEKIEKLIDMALRGALPRARALKTWEPDKLNSRHISVVMLRAVGYRQNRIAELTGYEPSVVSIVLGHPDSRTLLAAILAESAKATINITAEVRRHAPKMLEIVTDIANDRDSKPETRLKAAFGWLGMYERAEERKADDPRDISLPKAEANRLIAAIREAQEIPEVSYVIVGEGGGSSQPSALVPGTEPSFLPDGAASPDELAATIKAAELEDQLEVHLKLLESRRESAENSPADPFSPPTAAVGNQEHVSRSDGEIGVA